MPSLIVAFTLALASTLVHAAPMAAKPGLWSMQVEVENNGKKVNLNDQLNQAMAKMTPEQKQKMQGMVGSAAGDQGTQTCLTQDMLTPEKMLQQQGNKTCQTKFTTNTPTHIVGTFNCEDGTKGDVDWKVSAEKMDGVIQTESSKRGKAKVKMAGKFVSADCGKVKPPVR